MCDLCRLIWCGLVGFFRSEPCSKEKSWCFAIRLNVLRRKSSKRPIFGSIDRLIFAGLYDLAPNLLSALAIVRPDTVIRWHRRFSFVLAMEVKIARGSSEAPRRY